MKKSLILCLALALLFISMPAGAAPLKHPIIEKSDGPTDFLPGEMFTAMENMRIHFSTDNEADVYGIVEDYGFVTYGAWTYSVEAELIFWCGGLTTVTYGTSTGGFSWKAALYQFQNYISNVLPELLSQKELDSLLTELNDFLSSEEVHLEKTLNLESISGLSLVLDKAIDSYYDPYLMICISLPDYEGELYDYLYYKDYDYYYDEFFYY